MHSCLVCYCVFCQENGINKKFHYNYGQICDFYSDWFIDRLWKIHKIYDGEVSNLLVHSYIQDQICVAIFQTIQVWKTKNISPGVRTNS